MSKTNKMIDLPIVDLNGNDVRVVIHDDELEHPMKDVTVYIQWKGGFWYPCKNLNVWQDAFDMVKMLDYMNNKSDFKRTENLNRAKIINQILAERDRQNELWGEQNHEPDKWFSILGEEIGEACQDNNDGYMGGYREELVQAAAVIVQMIECFDRNV